MNLDDTLPPILSQIDDHEPEVVLKGLIELLQCLDQVGTTELAKRNWALVIYDALTKLIYQKDAQVVAQLGASLLKILPIVETVDPKVECDKFTKYDETLKKILFTMEFSSEWGQKKAWLIHLETFLEKMGHATMHWVDRINDMLLDYVSGSTDWHVWLLVLKVVQSLIKNTWTKPSSKEWTQIILKILFNQGIVNTTGNNLGIPENIKDSDSSELYETIKESFHLMSHCEDFPEIRTELRKTIQAMRKEDNNLYGTRFLQEFDKCEIITIFIR